MLCHGPHPGIERDDPPDALWIGRGPTQTDRPTPIVHEQIDPIETEMVDQTPRILRVFSRTVRPTRQLTRNREPKRLETAQIRRAPQSTNLFFGPSLDPGPLAQVGNTLSLVGFPAGPLAKEGCAMTPLRLVLLSMPMARRPTLTLALACGGRGLHRWTK